MSKTTATAKLKKSLENIQEIKNQVLNNDGDLKVGDIVLNCRDGELGIVLGPLYPNFEGRPAPEAMARKATASSSSKKLSLGGVSTKGKVVQDMYYLILTSESTGFEREMLKEAGKIEDVLKPLDHPKDVSKLGEEDKKFYSRIKYVKRKYLIDTSTITGGFSTSTPTDLEYYCKNQCIMECTADCVFHKYGCRGEKD